MKNKIFAPVLALLVFFGIAATVAFSPSVKNAEVVVSYDENNNVTTIIAPTKGTVIAKAWALDTLTNAANDTLTLPELTVSPYQYCFQMQTNSISGTKSIKFYLEQTAASGSSRYMKVDSVTASGAVTYFMMKGANTWGNKLRVIADGSGTQSTSYRVDAYLKKTNSGN